MAKCFIACLVTASLVVPAFTPPAFAQEGDVPLAGSAGQVVAAASQDDTSHFAGSDLFSDNWGMVFDLGRVVEGEEYDFRVFARNCVMRVLVLVVGEGNSTAVTKTVGRGTGSVTVNFTAPRDGQGIGVTHSRRDESCAGFVDTVNR